MTSYIGYVMMSSIIEYVMISPIAMQQQDQYCRDINIILGSNYIILVNTFRINLAVRDNIYIYIYIFLNKFADAQMILYSLIDRFRAIELDCFSLLHLSRCD